MQPATYTYLTAADWKLRIAELRRIAAHCALCPRRCGVDRDAGETGFCGAPAGLVASSIFPHHGEEPPLSGSGGSGTVFFTHCTLKCLFCQNYQISHEGEGRLFTQEELAQKLLHLQAQGCHNINLVTATHLLPWILPALRRAAQQGLTLPIVYNCGGYELAETIDLLKDVVDIWLPDMKYGDNAFAQRYSAAPDYVEVNQAAVRRMFRQVGPLRVDEGGIAERGLLIRHLVLPNGQSASFKVLDFLRQVFDPQDITISLMAQYRPLYRARTHSPLHKRLERAEYETVKAAFLAAGFSGFFQEPEKLDSSFVIDFKTRKEEPLMGG
ncbi:MAG: radical SAM protein [Desulfobacterales bacterium]|nr:radical SAM protein [Desulfobacterales bacterium]